VREIARVGLRAASLTDHDTVAGWPAFRDACGDARVDAIPGIEISGQFGERDAHVLGYGIDPDSATLAATLTKCRLAREERGREMAERLNRLGVPIRFDRVLERAGGGVIGRPHVADVLLEMKAVGTYEEAFRRYLGVGAPAYVPKTALRVEEAIELIHAVGGVAVLAHPATQFDRAAIVKLAAAGLDGVEVIHPRHTVTITRALSETADAIGLFVTGGSDYHGGDRGEARIGAPAIQLDWVTTMKERYNHE
jgi:predicted metal-dependent phosphoesterase TrpH